MILAGNANFAALHLAAAAEELLGKLLRAQDGTPYLDFLQRIMMEAWHKLDARAEARDMLWRALSNYSGLLDKGAPLPAASELLERLYDECVELVVNSKGAVAASRGGWRLAA